MIESSITSKGQTTLPKVIRETLGIETGDRIRYVIYDDEVRILPVRPIGRLYGVLEYDGPIVTAEAMDQAVADGACEESAVSTEAMDQAVADGASEE